MSDEQECVIAQAEIQKQKMQQFTKWGGRCRQPRIRSKPDSANKRSCLICSRMRRLAWTCSKIRLDGKKRGMKTHTSDFDGEADVLDLY